MDEANFYELDPKILSTYYLPAKEFISVLVIIELHDVNFQSYINIINNYNDIILTLSVKCIMINFLLGSIKLGFSKVS